MKRKTDNPLFFILGMFAGSTDVAFSNSGAESWIFVIKNHKIFQQRDTVQPLCSYMIKETSEPINFSRASRSSFGSRQSPKCTLFLAKPLCEPLAAAGRIC
jgi:hypothetical protein